MRDLVYIDNEGITDPHVNLAIEEYALRHLDPRYTYILFYVNEPSIIIGRGQNTLEEIDTRFVKEQGIHEGCIEQIQRLFHDRLYSGQPAPVDEQNRLRLDDWELRDEVQNACREIWQKITDDTIYELTDYRGYKDEFLRLFGFGLAGVDYDADVNPEVNFDVIELV